MEVSFPEQQASGSAIIIAAKFMLPDMTVDEKLTVAPLFHSALELISSFDKVREIKGSEIIYMKIRFQQSAGTQYFRCFITTCTTFRESLPQQSSI